MNWFQTVVLYLGIVDAIAIMLGGLVTAIVILGGWDAAKLWERIWPATAVLIGSNIAAAIILYVVNKVVG